MRLIELEPDPLAVGPAAELATSRMMVELAARAAGPTFVRFYVPRRTMAFGRGDTRLVGYPSAVGSTQLAGFEPVTRIVGGRAAAYHPGSLVMEMAGFAENSAAGSRHRFISHAEIVRDELVALGVDARVGRIPGEYCPGEFSVNARGAVKLMGSAQRVTRNAWILSSVIQVDDAESIRSVTQKVYAALGLDWSPATVGAVAEEAPGATVGTIATRLRARYARDAAEFTATSTREWTRRLTKV